MEDPPVQLGSGLPLTKVVCFFPLSAQADIFRKMGKKIDTK